MLQQNKLKLVSTDYSYPRIIRPVKRALSDRFYRSAIENSAERVV